MVLLCSFEATSFEIEKLSSLPDNIGTGALLRHINSMQPNGLPQSYSFAWLPCSMLWPCVASPLKPFGLHHNLVHTDPRLYLTSHHSLVLLVLQVPGPSHGPARGIRGFRAGGGGPVRPRVRRDGAGPPGGRESLLGGPGPPGRH
jgi:hypothetical protein